MDPSYRQSRAQLELGSLAMTLFAWSRLIDSTRLHPLGRGIFETFIVFAETRARAGKAAAMYVYMENARRKHLFIAST